MEQKGFEITLNKRLFVKLCNHFSNITSEYIKTIERYEGKAGWENDVAEAHENIQLANEMLGVLYKDED